MTDDNAPPNSDLFAYSEKELLEDKILNHYQILQIEEYSSQNDVKKAYRKRSLKYHPDKTGRGDDDYVFLAVKHAYEVLFDNDKRIAYDSTELDFDDSIPPPRSQLLQDMLYQDNDFYKLFGPVFARNIRFDLRLRPELSKQRKSKQKRVHPPDFGHAETPIADVHLFYEYWIHFESWRDFRTQASQELQIDLEHADSRFEKRYLQKEIDKRAKKLKQLELQRINTLVERAMECDPRLRQHRQEQQALKREEKLQKQRAKEQRERDEQLQKQQEEERQQREQEEKIKNKQLMRTERQRLRRLCGVQHNDNADIEYLCLNMTLLDLSSLNDSLDSAADALQCAESKCRSLQEASAQQQQPTPPTTVPPEQAPPKPQATPFTKAELSNLAKAAKKYPPGSGNRWDQITNFVNNVCGSARTKDDYLQKYNQIARNNDASDANNSDNKQASNGNHTTASDGWSTVQDGLLQSALAQYPASMEKNERWNAIAKHTGRTKKECVQRFKAIRAALKNGKSS